MTESYLDRPLLDRLRNDGASWEPPLFREAAGRIAAPAEGEG